MPGESVLELRGASAGYGSRRLWQDLDFSLQAGEFVAILGPNGSGKTSLLRVILGQLALQAGSLHLGAGTTLGYVPQHKDFRPEAPLRGRDLVGLALDGQRPGIWPSRGAREKIAAAIAEVGAQSYADAPISMLSGGELQRLRVAGALVSNPKLLLCDEPLVSLDLGHQRDVCEVLAKRKAGGTAILFVTHEINPVADLIDRVVYIARGQARIGRPEQVMTSEVLSDLYQDEIKVIVEDGRYFVLGAAEDHTHHGPRPPRGGSECCEEEH